MRNVKRMPARSETPIRPRMMLLDPIPETVSITVERPRIRGVFDAWIAMLQRSGKRRGKTADRHDDLIDDLVNVLTSLFGEDEMRRTAERASRTIRDLVDEVVSFSKALSDALAHAREA